VAAEVYKPENRTLAVGDRLQFRHPDNRRNIANGEFAVITAMDSRETTIRFQDKQNREFTLPLSAMRHVDYGYTVTSFSSQGSTVDRVIVNDDSTRSSRLVNREQLYVSISRGRIDARVYTNDAEALRLAVTRTPRRKSRSMRSSKSQPRN
jgi:ATP-dependent exoDNAse (exonuclease V) alpha subunit